MGGGLGAGGAALGQPGGPGRAGRSGGCGCVQAGAIGAVGLQLWGSWGLGWGCKGTGKGLWDWGAGWSPERLGVAKRETGSFRGVLEAGVFCSVWGAAGVLQMSWGCCRSDGGCDQREFWGLGSWGLGQRSECCRHARGALGVLLLGCHHRVPLPTAGSGGDPLCNFPRKPGCTLRSGWEAALLAPLYPTSQLVYVSQAHISAGEMRLLRHTLFWPLWDWPFKAAALTGAPSS